MALGVVPAEVYELSEIVEKLKKTKPSYETPTSMEGYTLDKLPAAKYALKGGKVNTTEMWDDYQYTPGGELGGVPSVGQGEDPYEYDTSFVEGDYRSPSAPKLKEGYRMGESGNIQKKRIYEEYEPYKWELEDPYSGVRSQLTEAENTRVAKLTDTRNQLAEKESKLLAYNRTIRGYSGDAASRPGTRKKTVLGGRPSLG